MAEISKLKLPNGDVYDLKVSVDHISGQLPVTKGGTGASTAASARENLGLGTAATSNVSNSVGNDSNLPTGAAIQTYVTNITSGIDTNTTYTLSMSGNVITLTGSNSSTSSITLPVYNGGVST